MYSFEAVWYQLATVVSYKPRGFDSAVGLKPDPNAATTATFGASMPDGFLSAKRRYDARNSARRYLLGNLHGNLLF